MWSPGVLLEMRPPPTHQEPLGGGLPVTPLRVLKRRPPATSGPSAPRRGGGALPSLLLSLLPPGPGDNRGKESGDLACAVQGGQSTPSQVSAGGECPHWHTVPHLLSGHNGPRRCRAVGTSEIMHRWAQRGPRDPLFILRRTVITPGLTALRPGQRPTDNGPKLAFKTLRPVPP